MHYGVEILLGITTESRRLSRRRQNWRRVGDWRLARMSRLQALAVSQMASDDDLNLVITPDFGQRGCTGIDLSLCQLQSKVVGDVHLFQEVAQRRGKARTAQAETYEIRSHKRKHRSLLRNCGVNLGGLDWNRTSDTRIFNAPCP